jgi:parallel beta-helix repeat protein
MCAAWLIGPITVLPAVDLFVATDGNDRNPGSQSQPFATFEQARDTIRRLRAISESLRSDGAHVFIRGGRYYRQNSFTLDVNDSGTAEAPVIYSAYPEETVWIVGGVDVPLTEFTPLTEEPVTQRIPLEARSKVLSVNLKERGITEFGDLALYGASVLPPYQAGENSPELFVDGQALTLARWPNTGYALIESVTDAGSNLRMWQPDMVGHDDRRGKYVPPEQQENPPRGFAFSVASERPKRWTTADDAWMYGYWYWDWSDQSVQIESINSLTGTIHTRHASGYSVREKQRFFAYNLLEELDAPGEWYLDRTKGALYLLPLENSAGETATLSLSTEPLIQIVEASNVAFQGLSLGMTRGDAIHVRGGENVRIERCDLGNTGGKAIIVDGGTGHIIRDNFIHDTGAGGVSVSGGDRQTLTPAGHVVANNEITRFSRLRKMYAEAIALAGVGNRAVHNLIHDAPHAAIHFAGNDHSIEFNEIHHVLLESDDAGAVYSGRRLTFWGNKIRNNYFHDINGLPPGTTRFKRNLAHAVYLDDALSGIEVTGNVFQRCNDAICVKGSDNRLDNNVIIDCRQSIVDHSRKPGGTHTNPLRFDRPELLPSDFDLTMLTDILSVPYKSPTWLDKYPGLPMSLESTYGPWRVSISGNVICQTPEIDVTDWLREHGRVADNHLCVGKPPSSDRSALQAWIDNLPGHLPGFVPIPWNEIGLRHQK